MDKSNSRRRPSPSAPYPRPRCREVDRNQGRRAVEIVLLCVSGPNHESAGMLVGDERSPVFGGGSGDGRKGLSGNTRDGDPKCFGCGAGREGIPIDLQHAAGWDATFAQLGSQRRGLSGKTWREINGVASFRASSGKGRLRKQAGDFETIAKVRYRLPGSVGEAPMIANTGCCR